MAKSYFIGDVKQTNLNEFQLFDNYEIKVEENLSATYLGVLNIFKEVFKIVDFSQNIGK